MKRIIQHDQMELSQEYKAGLKINATKESITITHHIKEQRRKTT